MDIYSPIIVTEEIKKNFKPTRLYIKECAGLKYFGKSTRINIDRYFGSGKYWTYHIKKCGKEKVRTLWISDWFYDPCVLQDFSIKFSTENDIVNSQEWANLISENGLSGGTVKHNYFATSNYNKIPKSAESNLKRSKSLKGKISSMNSYSVEANIKTSQSLRNHPILECPHCGLKGRFIGRFKGSHFERCKQASHFSA